MNGTETRATGMVIRTPNGVELPLIARPGQLAGVLFDKTDRAVRADCENGAIGTLPRASGDGEHWRIPVAKLLDAIGVPYEIVSASDGGESVRRADP
jgi:hypothetical protein